MELKLISMSTDNDFLENIIGKYLRCPNISTWKQ
jgi:hypothetical protein